MSEADAPAAPVAPPPATLPVERDWLEKQINDVYGTKAVLEDTKCQIIGEGKGFLSVITLAGLVWKASDEDTAKLPKSVIIKQPTMEKIKKVPMMAQFFSEDLIRTVHNRECNAYEFFALHPPVPFPMAKCIYNGKMTEPETGLLILEVVEGRSTTFNENFSMDQIMTLAGYIAKAQAYALKHSDELKEYIGGLPFDGFQMMIPQIPAAAKAIREKDPDIFTVSDETIQAGMDGMKATMDDLMKITRGEDPPFVPVLCFADMQPNNILWKTDKDGNLTAEANALIDFQMMNRGPAFYDLTMVMTMGMELEDQRNRGEEVFKHYYQTLEKALGTTPPVTFDEIIKGYRENKKMTATFMIQFVSELYKIKEMFGMSDERIRDMIRKISFGFEEEGRQTTRL